MNADTCRNSHKNIHRYHLAIVRLQAANTTPHPIAYKIFLSAMVVLTIYLVKSFEYRTMKTMVLKDVNLDSTTKEFKQLIDTGIL